MTFEFRRDYDLSVLPIKQDVEKYRVPYIPEKWTDQEIYFLTPFFTNLDLPIFITKNLPEEVTAALASRYSRAEKSARRIFLEEYLLPIAYPQNQKNWNDLGDEERSEKEVLAEQFLYHLDFLHDNGGMERTVNVQRAQKFFQTWLAEFGDDSIAEEGGVHVYCEGFSEVVVNEIQRKRIAISAIQKSSRYVSFAAKDSEGNYQMVIPGEIKGSGLEDDYRNVMNLLFDTYSKIHAPYLEYIKVKYPKGEDETNSSFERSRSAKRFDDIRDLLPFATKTNMGLYGNGRAFEELVTRLVDHPVGEARFWGQMLHSELKKAVPSFMERPENIRGGLVQRYKRNLEVLAREMSKEVMKSGIPEKKPDTWVKLISSTVHADIRVLSAFIFRGQEDNYSFEQVEQIVTELSKVERAQLLKRILEERSVGQVDPEEAKRERARYRKVPRAFETALYFFELWGRGGDYRDLHRHRTLSTDRMIFTTKWGYGFEKEVLESPFVDKFIYAMEMANDLHRKLEIVSPHLAQYAVPFGYFQHWYSQMSARAIYWIDEIRTGPQGRPHYAEICKQIAAIVKEKDPSVFQGLLVDTNTYSLARRESEIRTEKKKAKILDKK